MNSNGTYNSRPILRRIVLHAIASWRGLTWCGPGYYRWHQAGNGTDWWPVDLRQAHMDSQNTWFFTDPAEWQAESLRCVAEDRRRAMRRYITADPETIQVAA